MAGGARFFTRSIPKAGSLVECEKFARFMGAKSIGVHGPSLGVLFMGVGPYRPPHLLGVGPVSTEPGVSRGAARGFCRPVSSRCVDARRGGPHACEEF